MASTYTPEELARSGTALKENFTAGNTYTMTITDKSLTGASYLFLETRPHQSLPYYLSGSVFDLTNAVGDIVEFYKAGIVIDKEGTTTIDWKLGNTFDFQFGAFNEVFTFTAPTKAGTFILKLVQDSVGSRTATFPASVKWVSGTAPTLTTTATTGTDIITFYYDGTSYFAVYSINFS